MSNYTIEKSENKEWLESASDNKLGLRVQPDGWNSPSYLVASDWEKADYRLPSARYTDLSFAVNVSLSTRSRKVYMTGYETKVRVQIIFVGDCEADVVVYGWMYL